MKISATIKKVHPAISGTSQNGDYKYVPIELRWHEQVMKRDGSCFEIEHEQLVNVMGAYASNFNIPEGTHVCADLRFRTREYDGKTFNSITCNYISLS